jgi:phytoene desaturase
VASSDRRRRAVDAFLAALKPTLRDASSRRAHGPHLDVIADFARLSRDGPMPRSARALCVRASSPPRVRRGVLLHSRCSSAATALASRHLRRLVYLQVIDGGWYADGGVYSLVEAMARPLDVRCGDPVERIEHAMDG